MDLFGQIRWEEMLGDLMVTTFLILLAASIVVVCLMVMFPLIDLAFKKKAKPVPRLAQVETWQHDALTQSAAFRAAVVGSEIGFFPAGRCTTFPTAPGAHGTPRGRSSSA